jgi:hypothetical protein
MIVKPKHFELYELVCPHVYYQDGELAWGFLDQKQLILMDWIRDQLGEVSVNNWYQEYRNSAFVLYIIDCVNNKRPILVSNEPTPPATLLYQRGLRCNICGLSYAKTQAGIIYVSGHFLGKADDFDVKGMTAGQVRQWLLQHQEEIPYPIRLEKNTSWVHMDCEDNLTGEKVQLING